MKICFRNLDLLKKHNPKTWNRLRKLSFKFEDCGNARQRFHTLEEVGPNHIKQWEKTKTKPIPKSFIRICIYKGKIIAWAMSFLGDLSCYTQPKYRRLEIQKTMMLYMKKHAFGLEVHDDTSARFRTFDYYLCKQKV
jgi:hypothetical protein